MSKFSAESSDEGYAGQCLVDLGLILQPGMLGLDRLKFDGEEEDSGKQIGE